MYCIATVEWIANMKRDVGSIEITETIESNQSRQVLCLHPVTGAPHKILDPYRVNFNKLVGTFTENNVTPHKLALQYTELHRTVKPV